jgi:hypothetical protein
MRTETDALEAAHAAAMQAAEEEASHSAAVCMAQTQAAQSADRKTEALQTRLTEEVASLQKALAAEVANGIAAMHTVKSEMEASLSAKMADAAAELTQTTEWHESAAADLESEIEGLKAAHITERDVLVQEHQTAQAQAAERREAAAAPRAAAHRVTLERLRETCARELEEQAAEHEAEIATQQQQHADAVEEARVEAARRWWALGSTGTAPAPADPDDSGKNDGPFSHFYARNDHL